MSVRRTHTNKDVKVCPLSIERDFDDSWIRPDSRLVSQGWVRRHVTDPARAEESRELYESFGYEVKVCRLTPADFGPQCAACSAVMCQSYVVLYTRVSKADRDAGPDDSSRNETGDE